MASLRDLVCSKIPFIPAPMVPEYFLKFERGVLHDACYVLDVYKIITESVVNFDSNVMRMCER